MLFQHWLLNYNNHQVRKKIILPSLVSLLIILGAVTSTGKPLVLVNVANAQKNTDNPPYLGVNMRGLYTTGSQLKNSSGSLPKNYYDDSFRLISQAGMNHVRYVFYWESYEKNRSLFINELITVANTADKWGIKVVYDNHQFHTSSWLNPDRGTGFPISFFKTNPVLYPYSSGGAPKYEAAKTWWTNWWNRSVKDTNGTDGWSLQANFLKMIVNAVDRHPSTLGYEILNEPQIHNNNEWDKIGKFNTFITDELRKVTQKTVLFSQQIPASLNDPTVDLTPENMAKMAPANKTNVVFKFSSGYGVPTPGSYFIKRFDIYRKAGEIAGVPIYIGEWNKVEREKVVSNNQRNRPSFEISAQVSDINQTEANIIVQTFKKANVWGMAYWMWNFQPNRVANFNIITVAKVTGTIQPTQYFDIVKNAYSSSYGNIMTQTSLAS